MGNFFGSFRSSMSDNHCLLMVSSRSFIVYLSNYDLYSYDWGYLMILERSWTILREIAFTKHSYRNLESRHILWKENIEIIRHKEPMKLFLVLQSASALTTRCQSPDTELRTEYWLISERPSCEMRCRSRAPSSYLHWKRGARAETNWRDFSATRRKVWLVLISDDDTRDD